MMPMGYGQLRDIQGLDPIPWWPPAIGWWLAALGVVLGVALLIWLWRVARRPSMSWRRDAQRQLRALRRRMRTEEPKTIAGELSELLRRIAIVRAGREQAAGLIGDSWLDWLVANDPTGFDWQSRGQLLLDLPYAPPGHYDEPERLQQLIDAALGWVAASDKKPADTETQTGRDETDV